MKSMASTNKRTPLLFAIATAMALIVALSCSLLCAPAAHAESNNIPVSPSKFAGTHTYYISAKAKKEGNNKIIVAAAKSLKSIKSSNTKVAKVKLTSRNGRTCASVTFKKPGKTKIKIKYGKKIYKATWIVRKYKNPFKTLKIGKYDYTSEADADNFDGFMRLYEKPLHQTLDVSLSKSMSEKVINVETNPGFKITSITVSKINSDDEDVENGDVLPRTKGSQDVVISVKSRKDKGSLVKYWLSYYVPEGYYEDEDEDADDEGDEEEGEDEEYDEESGEDEEFDEEADEKEGDEDALYLAVIGA